MDDGAVVRADNSNSSVICTDDSSINGTIVRADDGKVVHADDGTLVPTDDGTVVRTDDGSHAYRGSRSRTAECVPRPFIVRVSINIPACSVQSSHVAKSECADDPNVQTLPSEICLNILKLDLRCLSLEIETFGLQRISCC